MYVSTAGGHEAGEYVEEDDVFKKGEAVLYTSNTSTAVIQFPAPKLD